MNIFERENTEIDKDIARYDDRFLMPHAVDSVEHLEPLGPVSFPYQFEHRLQLRLFVQFRANRAQYNEALKIAKTTMLHFLYRDALAEISAIRKYAMDGNRELIFAACERLEQAVGLKP